MEGWRPGPTADRGARWTPAEAGEAAVKLLAAAEAVVAASDALFGQGDLTALDAATLRAAIDELPHAEIEPEMTVARALVATGLVSSLSEARRAVAQGGVSLDGERVADESATIRAGLPGGVSIIRRGKKTLAGLVPRG